MEGALQSGEREGGREGKDSQVPWGLTWHWRTSSVPRGRSRGRTLWNNPPRLKILMPGPTPGPAKADLQMGSGDPMGIGFETQSS